MPSFTDKLTVNGSEMDMYAAVPSGGAAPYPRWSSLSTWAGWTSSTR